VFVDVATLGTLLSSGSSWLVSDDLLANNPVWPLLYQYDVRRCQDSTESAQIHFDEWVFL